jgi:hypothetical protein
MEETRRVLAERPQALLPLVGGGVLMIVRYIHSCALGKEANRVRIVEIFDLHDEIHHAAALVAAEAVVNALVGRDREGGCFFRMEWAQAKQIAALAGQGNVLADHVLNGIAGRQLVEKCWREWHCSLLSAPNWCGIASRTYFFLACQKKVCKKRRWTRNSAYAPEKPVVLSCVLSFRFRRQNALRAAVQSGFPSAR